MGFGSLSLHIFIYFFLFKQKKNSSTAGGLRKDFFRRTRWRQWLLDLKKWPTTLASVVATMSVLGEAEWGGQRPLCENQWRNHRPGDRLRSEEEPIGQVIDWDRRKKRGVVVWFLWGPWGFSQSYLSGISASKQATMIESGVAAERCVRWFMLIHFLINSIHTLSIPYLYPIHTSVLISSFFIYPIYTLSIPYLYPIYTSVAISQLFLYPIYTLSIPYLYSRCVFGAFHLPYLFPIYTLSIPYLSTIYMISIRKVPAGKCFCWQFLLADLTFTVANIWM